MTRIRKLPQQLSKTSGKGSPYITYQGGWNMAFSVNTNLAALYAHRNMAKTDKALTESLERLSSGLRINKAADDASGMAIANAFKAQALGVGQAIKNATDGISLIQIADGALEEATNILNTIRTKAVQAASDGQTTETRRLIQNDIDRLLEELDAIAQNTSFNGQKLLSGAFTGKKIQVGADAHETLDISIASAESTKVGHVSSAHLTLASADGGEVQLTITSSITGEQLTLNTVNIQYNNKAENGMGALADEINRYSSTTGIKATDVVEVTSSTAIQAGTTGSDFAINGVTIGAISVQANDANGALVNGINEKQAETGVTASITSDGKLTLSSTDGRAIKVTGDVSGVMGSTASQMSTIGYIQLTQSGVSEFQISGIGAGATGTDIRLDGDVTMVQDSVLAAGSTIRAGSKLAAGTVLGGDARVESSVSSTQLDSTLKAGSSLYAGSILATGTVLGGSITVAGLVDASGETSGNATTSLSQDMLVAAGSVLNEGTVIGKGTVVTTQFTVGSTTYNVGDTLTSSVTLDSEVTLTADMTFKYSSTAGDNSKIAAGSTLAAGTKLGANFTIGYTYDTTASADLSVTTTTTTTTTSDLYVDVAITGGAATDFRIEAGSLLASGTKLYLASGTWTGPTLVHTGGTLERGDTIAANTVFTLSGDQVISERINVQAATASGQNSIAAGSILLSGAVLTKVTAGGGHNATVSDALLASDMTLKSGSRLHGGSNLLAGSTLGSTTYVYGGSIATNAGDITTYQTTQLKAGSMLEDDSILAEGSTIGAKVTVENRTTLDSDMTLKAGSVLKYAAGSGNNTLLKAGTVITQDMTLNTGASGTASTEVSVQAGDVLTSDLYLDADVTLSADMTLKEDSILADASEIALNTSDAGTVGLSNKALNRLADLNVLSSAGAQLAIDIADAALKDLDSIRSSIGSMQNQLTSTISNLSVTMTNVQAAESGIRDVDFAEEAGNFSRLQVLAQAGSFALAQANASAQLVLSLLQ
jgi:flagellin